MLVTFDDGVLGCLRGAPAPLFYFLPLSYQGEGD